MEVEAVNVYLALELEPPLAILLVLPKHVLLVIIFIPRQGTPYNKILYLYNKESNLLTLRDILFLMHRCKQLFDLYRWDLFKEWVLLTLRWKYCLIP
jgi:hypothetical protein